MAKAVDMTRARKQALPIVLSAARAATRHVPMSGAQKRELEEALAAFAEVRTE